MFASAVQLCTLRCLKHFKVQFCTFSSNGNMSYVHGARKVPKYGVVRGGATVAIRVQGAHRQGLESGMKIPRTQGLIRPPEVPAC